MLHGCGAVGGSLSTQGSVVLYARRKWDYCLDKRSGRLAIVIDMGRHDFVLFRH